MGLFSGLDTEAYDRSYSDSQLISRIAVYFAAHKQGVFGATGFVVLVSIAGAGVPLVVSRGVEMLAQTPTIVAISVLTALMGLFGVGI